MGRRGGLEARERERIPADATYERPRGSGDDRNADFRDRGEGADRRVSPRRHDPAAAVDPNHPNVWRKIMVGTHLTLAVNSDIGEIRWGNFRMSEEGWIYGTLLGRGLDTQRDSYEGSALEAAGHSAYVSPSDASAEGSGRGYELSTSALGIVPGERLVFDYFAERPGFCDIALYARQWWSSIALDRNTESMIDLDTEDRVSLVDFGLSNDCWLERTDCNEPAERFSSTA